MEDQELTLSDYDRLFRENGDLVWISLTGGEPFLRKDFSEIVVSALDNVDKLHVINMATNGSMPESVEKCVTTMLEAARSGVYIFIQVSLDGSGPVHNEIRGVKDAYKKSLETFARLRKLKREVGSEFFNVKFEYTMSRFNEGMLRPTIDAVTDAGVPLELNDFTVTFAHNSFFYDNLQCEVKPQINAMLSEVSWFSERYPRRNLFDRVARSYLEMSPRYFNDGWRPPCVAGGRSCFINPFGNIYPCITMNCLLGNLKKDGFNLQKILGNRRSGIFREKIRPSCATCWTSCEAYQTIIFNFPRFLKDLI